jgi:beta-lactamase class D
MDSAGMQGNFALLENGTEQFTIHNLSNYKDSAAAPLNTFFIIPVLIGLDKGIVNYHDTLLNLNDSAQLYKAIIAKIGRQQILKVLDSLHYGKGIASADSTHFWEDGSLVITPDEQLGLIKRIYFKELFFQKKSQEKIKKMILMEDNSNYRLSYITGIDTTAGKNTAWVLGYVEENQHPYFFVLNTKANTSTNLTDNNINLLKKILLQQGFLKGTR